ncbi:MAG TPA: hypothetical protein VGO33_06870 [Gemmatimonadaceae bacterium]|jgi:hypothetical protein|nr:hypothetical protein [Gemmatimonadaceae bacterium]
MSRIRTVAIWVGALELAGLFLVVRGYRARDHTRSVVAIGNIFRPQAAVAPIGQRDPSSASAGGDTLPEDPQDRVAWFSKRYSESYAAAEHRMALDEGADVGLLPREWPHAKYAADAAAYPGVETYFLGYLRYLDKARVHYAALMDSIATITIVEAKLQSADSADVIKELRQALTANRATNLKMFDNGEAYGQAAIRLHYFLASLGPRVSYDSQSDATRFEVDAERQKAAELLADLQRSAAKLNAAAIPR